MRKGNFTLVIMIILGAIIAMNLSMVQSIGRVAEVTNCQRIDKGTYLVVCKTAEGTMQTISEREYAPGDILQVG